MEDTKLHVSRVQDAANSHFGTLSHDSGSGSDSDVIYVERGEEIIELSDDEKNCNEILKKFNVSDQLLKEMKEASNSISKKMRQHFNNKFLFREVMTEVPNSVWSLPWKVVSTVFRNPSVTLNKSPKTKKERKKRSGKAEEGSTKKQMKLDKPSVHLNEPVKIKEEKISDFGEDDRVLSVVHFDPNKPPEFCEVSRSGRLIKKPCRLKDDITFYKRRYMTRKSKDQKKTNDSVVDANDDIIQQPLKLSDESQIISDESQESCNDVENALTCKLEDIDGADFSLISDTLNPDFPNDSRNLDSTSTSFESDRVSNETNSFSINESNSFSINESNSFSINESNSFSINESNSFSINESNSFSINESNSFSISESNSIRINEMNKSIDTVVLDDTDESNLTCTSENSSELSLNLSVNQFLKNTLAAPPLISKNKSVSKNPCDNEKVVLHNYLERRRRKDLRFLIQNLQSVINEVRPDINLTNSPKVKILTDAAALIKYMESNIQAQKITVKSFEKRRNELMKNINSLYEMD